VTGCTAPRQRARRHREVHPRLGPGGRALPRLERVERVGDLGLQRVERLTGGAPVLRQERAQRALQLGEARVLERVEPALCVVEARGGVEPVEQGARVGGELRGLGLVVGEEHERGRNGRRGGRNDCGGGAT
jgi:hypothetical protein